MKPSVDTNYLKRISIVRKLTITLINFSTDKTAHIDYSFRVAVAGGGWWVILIILLSTKVQIHGYSDLDSELHKYMNKNMNQKQ